MWALVLSFLICLCLSLHLDSWYKRKVTDEEKFFLQFLFDPKGWSWKRKHMQYFLYDSYFINFLRLFLNGFIILLCGSWNFGALCVWLFVCLWGGLFCSVLLESLCQRRERMEGRCQCKSCYHAALIVAAVSDGFCWTGTKVNPFGGHNLYLLIFWQAAILLPMPGWMLA